MMRFQSCSSNNAAVESHGGILAKPRDGRPPVVLIGLSVLITAFGIGCRSTSASTSPKPASDPNCESLASLKLDATTINSAKLVPAGAFKAESGQPSGPVQSVFNSLQAFCRVQGVAKPSADSDIGFEVWMPVSSWNGKYQGI